jgi:hypothetical protein
MKKKNDRALIQQAIANLHKKQSGDYESIMREVSRRQVLRLNGPQLLASMSRAKMLALEWARGTGKTTIIGHRFRELVATMPRSSGIMVGPTYKLILTRILPSLIQGLEMFGLYENLHYFVGQQPPRAWRNTWGRAYQPPRDYARYITFWNGAGCHFISQDVVGDGRGLNTDWIIGDEAVLLDPEKLQENTDPTLRGTNTYRFLDAPLFGSKLYCSSTALTQEGMWFTSLEEKALENPKLTHFIRADCRENMHNLRPGYLEEARANALAEWIFEAEYLNVRPAQVRDGFYPLLQQGIHTYEAYDYNHIRHRNQAEDCRGDADLVEGEPLILSMDFGASINCLTVNQHLKSINEYRTLKSMYVLGDNQEIQDDLIKQFHLYYQYHNTREVFLWYDASGNHRTGITKLTRAQLAQKQLADLGWRVRLLTIGGSNPLHEEKYMLWNIILREDDSRYPRYRMNRHNCRELWISMSHARAVPGRGGEIKKDKSSERSKKISRQHATDLSDANDCAIHGMFSRLLRGGGAGKALPGARSR